MSMTRNDGGDDSEAIRRARREVLEDTTRLQEGERPGERRRGEKRREEVGSEGKKEQRLKRV